MLSLLLLSVRRSVNREYSNSGMTNLTEYKNNLQTRGATKCITCQEAQDLGLLQRAVSVPGPPVAGGSWVRRDRQCSTTRSSSSLLPNVGSLQLYLCLPPAWQGWGSFQRLMTTSNSVFIYLLFTVCCTVSKSESVLTELETLQLHLRNKPQLKTYIKLNMTVKKRLCLTVLDSGGNSYDLAVNYTAY